MVRLSGIPLSLLLLICASISSTFRDETADSLKAVPLLSILLVAFSILQLVSVAISKKPFFSLDRFVVENHKLDRDLLRFRLFYLELQAASSDGPT